MLMAKSKRHRTLTRLDLNDNHIDEGGGTSLGKVLQSNDTLVHVELGRGAAYSPEELVKVRRVGPGTS